MCISYWLIIAHGVYSIFELPLETVPNFIAAEDPYASLHHFAGSVETSARATSVTNDVVCYITQIQSDANHIMQKQTQTLPR